MRTIRALPTEKLVSSSLCFSSCFRWTAFLLSLLTSCIEEAQTSVKWSLTHSPVFSMCWLGFIPFWVEVICHLYNKWQKDRQTESVLPSKGFPHPLLVELDIQRWQGSFYSFFFLRLWWLKANFRRKIFYLFHTKLKDSKLSSSVSVPLLADVDNILWLLLWKEGC